MGAGHHKHTASAESDPRRLRRLAVLLMAPIAVVTIAAMVALWPSGDFRGDRETAADEINGTVQTVQESTCDAEVTDPDPRCGTATVLLDDDRTVGVELPTGPGAPRVGEGDAVVLLFDDGPDGEFYSIVDQQRSIGLWVGLLAFAFALFAFGRWRGLTALVGLGVTFLVLLFFVVPAIIGGEQPVLVAIVGSTAIALSVLYLTHGFGAATTVALIGTLAAFVLTGLLAWLATVGLHLTGVTDDIAMSVETSYGIDMGALLIASIIIGSLGVLDDVTVTQSVTVRELARANPDLGGRQLYRSATRVGRSHIASVVNTIVLAYAGASLPLLVLVVADNTSLGGVLTDQYIAQEIARSLVATLGLIAAVPITTALAAWLLRDHGSAEAPGAPHPS